VVTLKSVKKKKLSTIKRTGYSVLIGLLKAYKMKEAVNAFPSRRVECLSLSLVHFLHEFS